MTIDVDPHAARRALTRLPEIAAQENLEPPELARVYVPAQHVKALHLDASVVVGMRGAGKSLWTAVLANDEHKRFVSDQLPGSSLERVTARVGFGLDDTETAFPTPDTLGALVGENVDPVDIWQTVVLRHVLRAVKRQVPFSDRDWKNAVGWLVGHRAEANTLLTEGDATLADDRRVLLVLFDAFDRLASDWERVQRLTKGALELGLRLRSRRAIRTKFFVRPDIEEDESIWGFADSSKLRHARVDLAWSPTDLYGLVFMHVGNETEFGPRFREETRRVYGAGWSEKTGVHIPHPLLSHEKVQRPILEALADRYMGGGPKRGHTYSWVPLHLADAKGRISPRSYLLAFKSAAEYSTENWAGHGRALHYTAIQHGVVKASAVRVSEISEDYPWVRPLLDAAQGTMVPMTAADLLKLWPPRDSLVQQVKPRDHGKLPPRRFTNDPLRKGSPDALLDDLVDLAVLYRTKDRRLNMPDIFRVGLGIRRKGGVKPPR